MKLNKKNLLKRFRKVDVDSIQDEALKAKALKLKAKQGGFTLLELLVVVAILAAIAGTATIALQDTDARAAAAAHVAMMDELNKGVRTFRVLQRNALPNNLDSLMEEGGTLLPNGDGEILGIGDVAAGAQVAGMAGILSDIGMSDLRYINGDAAGAELPADVTSCAVADLQDAISSRANAVVAGNIFNGPSGNGCGVSLSVAGADGDVDTVADNPNVAYWTGTVERIIGPGEYGAAAFDGTAVSGVSTAVTATAPIYMAVGMGPSSNLFNTQELGGLTSVPVYRHVSPDQYNRFIGLFHVANSTTTDTGTTWSAPVAADQVAFVAVVDGAGDTKEEELGEWDGTRNTI